MLSTLQCATCCAIKLLTTVHEEYFASATPVHTKCHRTVTIFFLVVVVPGRLLQSWPSTRIVHGSFPLIRRSQMRLMWPLWRSGFMVSHNASSTANTFGPCGNRPWKSLRVGLPLLSPVLTPRGLHQYEPFGSCRWLVHRYICMFASPPGAASCTLRVCVCVCVCGVSYAAGGCGVVYAACVVGFILSRFMLHPPMFRKLDTCYGLVTISVLL